MDPINKNAIPTQVLDKRYKYITPKDYEEAAKNGIPATLLERRVRSYSWDVDKAIRTPKRKRRSFVGTWKKWEEIAKENGINREIFTNRVRNLNWNEEDAATIRKNRKVNSRWSSEEVEIAKKNGINMNTVRARVDMLGWSKHEALHTPILSKEEIGKRIAEGTRKYHEKRGVNREFNKIN